MGDFIFNVKGLTAQDRAQWEKDNIEALNEKNYFKASEEQRERYFRDASFRNKYGSRSDYDTLKKYNANERDSIFNLDLQDEDTVNSILENTNTYNNIVNRLHKWHKEGERALKEFDEISSSLSPYYERYLGTNYLPWNEEDKINNYAKYQVTLSTLGKEAADKELKDNIQNTVANNQGTGDTYMRGANNFSTGLIGATQVGLGVIGGLVASPFYMAMEGEDSPTKDLNFFEKYLHYVVNNDLTEYGHRTITRGTFDPRVLTSDDPKDNWNRNEIIHTTEEEENTLDFIFSRKFIPELMGTAGFTAAAMLEGQALSYAARGLAAWRTASVLNKVGGVETAQKALEQIKNIAKWERRWNAYAVPALVGTTEGVENALGTYDSIIEDGTREIDEAIKAKAEALKQSLLENPAQMKELGFSNLSEEALDYQIMQSLAPEREDMLRKLNEVAAEGELVNLGLNSFTNGAFNILLKSPMFGGRVKEAVTRSLQNTRVGKFFSSNTPSFTYNAGKVEAVLPSTLKTLYKAGKETAGESGEEWQQEIEDKAAQGAALYSLENFIARRLNGEAYDAIEDDLSEMTGAALYAAGEAAISKEAIRSAVMGGFSQALGTATINKQAFHDMQNAKGGWNKAGHLFRTFYRNPFVEEFREARAEKDVKVRTAKAIEDWLNTDNNLERFTSITGAASWIKEMNEQNEKGDEFSYKSSKFGKLVNDAFMLHDLKGTELYDSYIQQYLDILSTEEGTKQAATIEKESGMSLEDAKKHAQTMLDNIDNVNKGLEEIEGVLGKHIDSEVKKALVYGKLSYENWDSRGRTIEKELREIRDAVNQSKGNYGFVMPEKEVIEKGVVGSESFRLILDRLIEESDRLHNEIEPAKKNIKHLSKKQKAELKEKEKKYKELRKEISELEKDKDSNTLLTADVIMGLNPTDRYKMLNPENRKFYSEKQLAIIDNLVNEMQLKDANFMQKVEDAARIEQAKEAYLIQYNESLRDPNNLNKLATILRTNIAIEQQRAKYKYLNAIDDKKKFLEEFEKAFDEAKDMISKQSLIETVKDNPFYKEIMESEEEAEDFNVQKNNNELYRSLEDKKKVQIDAVEAFLQTKKISPKSIESLEAITANNGNDLLAFINEWNQNNPDNQIEFNDIGEVIANYQSLVDDLIEKERDEKKITEKPAERKETPIQETKPAEEKPVEGAPEPVNRTQRLVNPTLKSLESNPRYQDGIQEVRDFIDTLENDLGAKEIAEALANHEFNNPVSNVVAGKLIDVLQGNKFARATQERKAKEQEEKEKENISLIDILVLNSFRGEPGFEAFERFYTIYGIDNYLKSHVITNKEGIFFIYDPALASQVSSSMIDSYAVPIVLAIQSNEGKYEVNGVKYQPIGIYKNVDATKKGLLDNVQGNTQQVIQRDGKPVVTTIFKYIRTEAPQHINKEEPNIPIGTVAFNDESPAIKERYNQSSKEEQDIFYINLRDRILKKIKYIGKDENPRNKAPHLAYTDVDGRVGVDSQIDIFISDPENTVTRDGKSFREVLLRGDINELFTYNSRLYGVEDTFGIRPRGKGLVNALRLFFENKPFDSDNLKKINKDLNEAISNYVVLSNRQLYKIEIVPTNNKTENGTVLYSLRLKGPTKIVEGTSGNYTSKEYDYELGTVHNGTISNEELAKIVKNLFLDENNNFRKVLYNEKEEPLVKWHVDYNSFERGNNDKTSGAKVHREEVYDDNILTVSKTSLQRTVTGLQIHTPRTELVNPKDTKVANKDNAALPDVGNNAIGGRVDPSVGIVEEGKPEKKSDDTEKNTEAIVKRIIEKTKQLAKERTDRGVGVTTIIRDTYSETDQDAPQFAVGNVVDRLIRDIFDPDTMPIITDYPNGTSEMWRTLLDSVVSLREKLHREGYKFISNVIYPDNTLGGVRTRGTIEVTDNNGKTHSINVNAVLDLLAYNPVTGKFRIYDVKTMNNKSKATDIDTQIEWGRQLKLYKKFLEEEFGIEVESTHIIPIYVKYPKASYTVKDGQLYIGDKEFRGLETELMNTVDIDTSKINFKAKFSSLSPATQQALLGEVPTETKPVEVKEAESKPKSVQGKGKLKRKASSESNILKDFHLGKEAFTEGSETLESDEYSFDRLKTTLTDEQYKALEERIKSLHEELTKEYWDALPTDLKKQNLECIKG